MSDQTPAPVNSPDTDHPAITAVALIINDVRMRIGQGRGPLRAIAAGIVHQVFFWEATRWASTDVELEGGIPRISEETVIEPVGTRDWHTGMRETHHRMVMTFYGPWVEGSVADAERAAAEAPGE